jgi:hypothetical protein
MRRSVIDGRFCSSIKRAGIDYSLISHARGGNKNSFLYGHSIISKVIGRKWYTHYSIIGKNEYICSRIRSEAMK